MKGNPTIKLIPPDYLHCQRWKYEPFTMSGKVERQCGNRPFAILIEKVPNPHDGKKGAMSVCHECLDDWKIKPELKSVEIFPISENKKRVKS